MYSALLACILNIATVTYADKPAPGDASLEYHGLYGLALDEATDQFANVYIENLSHIEDCESRSPSWIKEKRLELSHWNSHSKIIGNWWDKEWFRYGGEQLRLHHGTPGDIINWGPFKLSSRLKFSMKDYEWTYKRSHDPYSYTFRFKPSLSVSTSADTFINMVRAEVQLVLMYRDFKYLTLSAYLGWTASRGGVAYLGAECKAW